MNTRNNEIRTKSKHVKSFLFIITMVVGAICFAQLQSPCACSGTVCATLTSSATPGNTAVTAKAKQTLKLPTFIDLGAEKCMACKMMTPIIAALHKEYKDILNVKFIDVWKKANVAVAKKYKIRYIPTQIFRDKDGKELWRHVGFIPRKDIMKKWKSLGYDFEKLKKAKTAVK